MIDRIKIQGTITAIVTPFNEDESIDYDSYKNLIKRQIDAGINSIVPCGTTGESPTLNYTEHKKVIEVCVDEVAGKVPVIAGTGSNSTREALELTKSAKKAGADAALVVSPYYNKPTQEGLYGHYMRIADVGLPIVVYNIHGRTGVNIETSTLERLCKHPNIVAVKEASGNINQMMDVIYKCPTLSVLSGDDGLTLPLLSIGGSGVISVASNVVPEYVIDMVDAGMRGDFSEASSKHYELLPMFRGLFIETNPLPVKTALAKMGLIKDVYRSPMCPMTEANKEKLYSMMSKYNLIN